MSALGLPATVTVPSLVECLNERWLPRIACNVYLILEFMGVSNFTNFKTELYPSKIMKTKTRKYLFYGIIGVICVILLPFIVFGGVIAYAAILTAFPTDEQAKVHFRRVTRHAIPDTVQDIYFRRAIDSPTDEGGSFIMFKSDAGSIDALISSESNWPTPATQWQSLASAYACPCEGCIRYWEDVVIPQGAKFKLRGKIRTRLTKEYTLLAVDESRSAVYMCRLDL